MSTLASAEHNIRNLIPQECSELDPADKISRFPNSILAHILSFLPTKYPVATSVLSKRWEFLSTQIHSYYFDDKMPSIYQRNDQEARRRMTFPQFVERVMLLRNTQYSIEKFHLNCCCDESHINSWISSATAAGVRELSLSVYTGEIIQLPRRLFSCNSLVVLRLSGGQILINAQRVGFPHLKTLHLCSVKYENDAAVSQLISSCYVLENLFIRHSELDNITQFDISSHTLKRLTAHFYGGNFRLGEMFVSFRLDTPKLQFLKIWGQLVEKYDSIKLPSLHEADVLARSFSTGFNLFSCLHNVKVLSLSTRSCFHAYLSFTRFCNLTHLKLEATFCMWKHLQEIFNTADNLEKLTYHEREPCCIRKHLQIIKCVKKPGLSRLSSVSFIGFHGGNCNIDLVSSILENAQVLTKFKVTCNSETSTDDKFHILQKISEIPRVSPTCKITFS